MERYKRIISGPMQKSHDLGVDIHFARVKMNTDGLSNREQIFPPLARHEDTEYAKENKRKQKHLLPPTSNRYGIGITISTLRDRWLALFKELGFSVSQPKTISNHLSTKNFLRYKQMLRKRQITYL